MASVRGGAYVRVTVVRVYDPGGDPMSDDTDFWVDEHRAERAEAHAAAVVAELGKTIAAVSWFDDRVILEAWAMYGHLRFVLEHDRGHLPVAILLMQAEKMVAVLRKRAGV